MVEFWEFVIGIVLIWIVLKILNAIFGSEYESRYYYVNQCVLYEYYEDGTWYGPYEGKVEAVADEGYIKIDGEWRSTAHVRIIAYRSCES